MIIPLSAALAATCLLAGLGPVGAASSDPLGVHRGRDRVLVVAAPDEGDPRLRQQRDVFARMGAGARERDLVLLEAVGGGTRADALRKAFDIKQGGFAVVLVGKDGGAKLRSSAPLGPDQLFPTIDAMPMRREEMSRTR